MLEGEDLINKAMQSISGGDTFQLPQATEEQVAPKKIPLIGVCFPSRDNNVSAVFALSLVRMVTHTPVPIRYIFMNGRSSVTGGARNTSIKNLERFNPDYYFHCDSDMSFPPDTVARLLAADKDIVGCNYLSRNPPHSSMTETLYTTDMHKLSGLVRVNKLPGGVCLVKADVYKKIPKPWYGYRYIEEPVDEIMTDDYYFCEKAIEAGYEIWCDFELSHLIVHWGDVGFRMNEKNGLDFVQGS